MAAFCDKDPSRSLVPMPLLSALSAPCSSSPHSPVGPYFSVETVSGLLVGFLTSRPFLQIIIISFTIAFSLYEHN